MVTLPLVNIEQKKTISTMPIMTLDVRIKISVRITIYMQGLSVRDCGEASCLSVPHAPYRARYLSIVFIFILYS